MLGIILNAYSTTGFIPMSETKKTIEIETEQMPGVQLSAPRTSWTSWIYSIALSELADIVVLICICSCVYFYRYGKDYKEQCENKDSTLITLCQVSGTWKNRLWNALHFLLKVL